MTETTRSGESVRQGALYVAFELGKKTWTLGVSAGLGVEPVMRAVPSADWGAVDRTLAQARAHFSLGAAAAVVSCYEAGRWILDSSRPGRARDRESGGGFVEH